MVDGTRPPVMSPALEVRDVAKAFGPRLVLADFHLTLERGEIHGLVGQNGSGKSTLIKILAGYHVPEPGAHISVCGRAGYGPEATSGASLLRFVHQDLALNGAASVLENFCITSFSTKRGAGGFIDWDKSQQRVVAALARFNPSIEPETLVCDLDPTDRAFVAIARAVEGLSPETGGVLVLDEPTAYLPKDGVEALFKTIRGLAESGIAVLFVSHDLGEVLQLTERVTVLRDGVIRYSGDTRGLDNETLIRHIVGRVVAQTDNGHKRVRDERADDVVMEAREIATTEAYLPSFAIRRGEIVGFTGLIGSGFSRPLYAMFGAAPDVLNGELDVDGQVVDIVRTSPAAMTRRRVGLIPSDRPGASSAPTLTALENLTLLLLGRFRTRGLLNRGRERAESESLLEKYGVSPPDPSLSFESFSGGNQQKLILAKWIETEPVLMLLHEPTQGVDVGARQEIYEKIFELAAGGTAVVVASANYEELPSLCDRVVIFRKGMAVAELTGDFDQETITRHCFAV